MKDKKLVIVLVLIIILLLIGGAYLLGRKENNEKNRVNPSGQYEVPTGPFLDAENDIKPEPLCKEDTSPWIKIISPNGGEKYYKNSSINLAWTTCNIPTNIHLSAQLIDVNNPSGGRALLCEGGLNTWGPECLNDSEQTFGNISWEPGVYKMKISSREGVLVSDISDNSFTIKDGSSPSDVRFIESGDDKNGHHVGYLKNISSTAGSYSLQIDYIQWIGCNGLDCPNGFKIVNDNPLIRKFPISDDIKVYDNNLKEITIKSLQSLMMSNESWKNNTPFWITLKDGKISEITEQYVP